MFTDPLEYQANATLPPPINWATRPVLSASKSAKNPQHLVEEPAANTGRRLSPVIVDVNCVGDDQEVLRPLGDSVFPEPTVEYQDEVPNNMHNLFHLLRHLGHSDFQQPRPNFQDDACLDGRDSSSEVQNLTSAFSGLSTLTNPTSSGPLAARTTPSARLSTPSPLSVSNCGLAVNDTANGTTSTNINPRGSLAIRTGALYSPPPIPTGFPDSYRTGLGLQQISYWLITIQICTGVLLESW
jgi:hypothetical protein